jgi:hypothetical protein
MIFVVKQVHRPEMCPAERGGTRTLYDASAPGVKLDRILGDFSAHTVYYILEADWLEDVQRFLTPGWLVCTSEVIPVSEEPIELPARGAEAGGGEA